MTLTKAEANQERRGTGNKRDRQSINYGENVSDILLEERLRDVTLITGTRIPLVFQCVERKEDGENRPVKGVEVKMRSEPDGMFTFNSDGTLTANASGVGEIWLETADGAIQSNRREFWTMDATDVSMALPAEPLLRGQRYSAEITFQTPDGPLSDCLIDAEVLDASFATIGRLGRMKIGLKAGNAIVRVKFGQSPDDYKDFELPIGNEKVEPRKGTGGSGSDVPDILLCGEEAPGMEDHPPERRTIPGGPDYPTIVEDIALFPNVVWINPESKEARRIRTSRGGSSGMGKIGNKTFMHFVAMKCLEILKRLVVRQKIAGDAVTDFTYMQYAAEAEMECSEFIDAAWEMTDDLLARDTSSNE